MGISQQAVADMESGDTQKSKFDHDLRLALERYGKTGSPEGVFSGETMPLFGKAAGANKGYLVMDNDPVEWVSRPTDLKGVANAFAVYATGDSMFPKYKEGDKLWVNPNPGPRAGDYVLIETIDQEGYIKKFKSWSDGFLVVEQFNPQKIIRFNSKKIKKVMKIVGMWEG